MKYFFKFSVILLFFIAKISFGQDNASIKSLSVFKNGQSFVVKEIKGNTAAGSLQLNTLPNALFGTYWFTGISSTIVRVSSQMQDFNEKQERKANSLLELLHANKGKTVTVMTTDNNSYKGIVEDFDLPEEMNSKAQLQQLKLTNNYQGLYGFDRIFVPAYPSILLKMDGKWISIEPSALKNIVFEAKPNRLTSANIAVQKPVVSLDFAKSGEQTFTAMYLQNGLSWTPTYRLELISETEAELSMQAEVINQVEDIKNTAIDFVIGAPNFSQATSLATLLNFTNAVTMPTGGLYSNAVQAMSPYSRDRAAESVAESREFAPLGDVAAVENEDLYFYTLKNISLAKGERAHYPIFNKPVKIRHYYKTILPASTMSGYRLIPDDATEIENEEENNTKLKPNTVEHFIEIYNSTETPFTSGAILVLQKNTQKPIAQDLLRFTAKTSSTPVMITTSPDILIKENEKVIATKKGAKTDRNSYKYALITVKGTVTIINSKSKNISIQIQKNIAGKLSKASEKYTESLLPNNYETNENRQLDFTVSVKPGEKKSFDYTYQLYIKE